MSPPAANPPVPPQEAPARISALTEILIWSNSRPSWQRDALRRIVTQADLSALDIEQLETICRATHDCVSDPEGKLEAVHLSDSHIPPLEAGGNSVSLVSIGNLTGVNRLPANHTVRFGTAPGLTIIYGENGSGKSGYARIIKKACRTRGAIPMILPDAFGANKGAAAIQADITFAHNGADHLVTWQEGKSCDARLSHVFVFDTLTAETYLAGDGAASFTPHGLDILPKLAKICEHLGQSLKADIRTHEEAVESQKLQWKFSADTVVGKFISGLSDKTAESSLDMLCVFSADDKKRLEHIRSTLKADPKKKAKETRAIKERLSEFREKLEINRRALGKEEMTGFRTLLEDAVLKNAAAKEFAKGVQDTSLLPGTFGQLWRVLWEAARMFSIQDAAPNTAFPPTEDQNCLLCQQPVGTNGARRMQQFEEFCKDQSQKLAQDAENSYTTAKAALAKISPLTSDLVKIEADLSSLGEETFSRLLSDYVKALDSRLRDVSQNITEAEWRQLTVTGDAPVEQLDAIIVTLEKRAKEEEAAEDPAVRKALETESLELGDKETLAGAKATVLAQLERLKHLERLRLCLRDVTSNSVTLKNSDLTKRLVTQEFCGRFAEEADKLALRTLEVKLEEQGGSKGTVRFGLRFNRPAHFAVSQVASEGEQRCIALAAFLAELSQASHQSALVFDDPVSSLDHYRRERIAKRLVEESAIRQVIVFTHDTCFLHDLVAHAEENSIETELLYLNWKGSQPGWCSRGLPWDCKSPEDRLDQLGKTQRELAKKWGIKPSSELVGEMRHAYSDLRATIERIVERVVLCDVVSRFRNYINLKTLEDVVGFSAIENAEVQRLFKRCCEITAAHDHSQFRLSSVLEPKDLKDDIDATLKLLTDLRSRKKAQPKKVQSKK